MKGSRFHSIDYHPSVGGAHLPTWQLRYADGKVQKRKVRETWQAQQPEHCSHDLSVFHNFKPGEVSKKNWLPFGPSHTNQVQLLCFFLEKPRLEGRLEKVSEIVT